MVFSHKNELEKGEEDRKQRQYVNLEVNRPIRYTVGEIPN